jgi:FAD/FMN-containing dehydrogenase
VLERPLLSISGRAVEEAAIRRFGASLLGELIFAGSERYEQARRHWSGLTDPRHPGLIIRCAATADVIRCVEFARRNEIAIAVRAGGHSFAGDSFCEGGIVIDISDMKAIRVDAERRRARANAGLTVGEFDRGTEPFGLASVLGECSLVGIAGFTLGGGLGRLMGKHGAACDNLLSAELVTADGGLVTPVLRRMPIFSGPFAELVQILGL